jgi:hypothetical protein
MKIRHATKTDKERGDIGLQAVEVDVTACRNGEFSGIYYIDHQVKRPQRRISIDVRMASQA